MSRIDRAIIIYHKLCISVVGNDNKAVTFTSSAFDDLLRASVYRLHGIYHCIKYPSMSHHVGVGEVKANEIRLVSFHIFADSVGHPLGAHFRLQVVRGNFWRGDQDAVFAAEYLFTPT